MSPDQAANPLAQFFPFLVIFFIFYFLVIKPEKDKQKKHKDAIANLKKNDQIVTSGGLHATVITVKPTTLVVRIDDSVKVEIERDAVATIVSKSEK